MERKKPSLQSGFDCTHHIHACLMHANRKKMLLIAQVIRLGNQQEKFKWHLLQKSFLHCHVEDKRPPACLFSLSQSSGAKRIGSATLVQMNLFDEFSVFVCNPHSYSYIFFPFLFLRKEKNEREKFVLIFCTFFSKFRSLHTWKRQTTPDSFLCDLHSVEITRNVSLDFLRISFPVAIAAATNFGSTNSQWKKIGSEN